MELNASVTMINRQIQSSFSLNIGWSWREESDPTAHVLRPRGVYVSLVEPSSQLFQQGVKVKL